MPLTRAHTLLCISQQRIQELEDENLNLKLRISQLEKQLQQQDHGYGDASSPQTLRTALTTAQQERSESTRAVGILEGQLADAKVKLKEAQAAAKGAKDAVRELKDRAAQEEARDKDDRERLLRMLTVHLKRSKGDAERGLTGEAGIITVCVR